MFDWLGLLETGRKVAGADAALAGDGELCDAAVALEQLRCLVDAAQGHVLAELDRRGTTDSQFGLSTGGWLAREAHLSPGVAKNRVRVGVALSGRFGLVDDALADGRISFEHARVIDRAANPRIADQLAELQQPLLDAADDTLFDWWRRDVIGLADLLDQDGGHDPTQDLARNQLTCTKTFDGLTHLAGTFVGEHGLCLRQAIEAKADELFTRYSRDHEMCPELAIPERATLRALALVELCRCGQATDLESTRPPRTEVTLVVNAAEPTTAVEPEGTLLADGTTRTLLCDPDLHAVVVDSLGQPLDLGSRVRYATTAQRRAMAIRDGGCIFPGCTAPARWCDAHHVTPFNPDGTGPTDIDNLAGPCRHHHRVTHRPGWQMHRSDDGWFWWQTPSGHTFWQQRHGRQRAGPAPPAA